MKLFWLTLGFFGCLTISPLAGVISGLVEKVYTNSILLTYTEKRPIYGQRQSASDSMVSEGNFLGGAPVSHDPPIIGYETGATHELLIENYHSQFAADGQQLVIQSVNRIGTTNLLGKTIELWYYGIPPEIIAADKAKKELAAKEAAAKNFQIQSNDVLRLQPQATNGDDISQYFLGLHYLEGMGCETNLEMAIFWLTKSANQGNSSASNLLMKIESPKKAQ